jgi:hypothetical protein
VTLAWHLSGRLALEGTGGKYLPDPYQGLPGGRFLTLGIRWTIWEPAWLSHEGVGQANSDLDQLTNQLAFNSSSSAQGGGKNSNVPGISKSHGGGNGSGRGHKP